MRGGYRMLGAGPRQDDANPHVDLCQNYPDRNFIHVNIARPLEKPRRLAMTQRKGKKAAAYTK